MKDMRIKADDIRRTAMSKDELQMHLHMKRKGSGRTKNGKGYTRKGKHPKRDDLPSFLSFFFNLFDINS